jgi:hypothetical protein
MEMNFFEAKEILKQREIVLILFDQNASEWRVRSTFLRFIAAMTPRPDF